MHPHHETHNTSDVLQYELLHSASTMHKRRSILVLQVQIIAEHDTLKDHVAYDPNSVLITPLTQALRPSAAVKTCRGPCTVQLSNSSCGTNQAGGWGGLAAQILPRVAPTACPMGCFGLGPLWAGTFPLELLLEPHATASIATQHHL